MAAHGEEASEQQQHPHRGHHHAPEEPERAAQHAKPATPEEEVRESVQIAVFGDRIVRLRLLKCVCYTPQSINQSINQALVEFVLQGARELVDEARAKALVEEVGAVGDTR